MKNQVKPQNQANEIAESPEPVKQLVPKHVMALEPYKPGRPADELKKELGIAEFVNLASNENPFGASPTVVSAIAESVLAINRYPDMGGFRLREKIAQHYHVKVDNVAIGSGSESIMANTIRAFLHGDDEVLTSEGTFIGFYVLIKAQGIKLNLVPLKDYRFDLDAIAAAITDKTKIVYLCNPNNPTGSIFTRLEFETFIKKVPEHVLVILDEAYHEFADHNDFPDSMTYRYDNVLTLRTFSKAYGMAGLRLGYGLGHDYLISFINKIKLPFEPNILAQEAGLAALADAEFLSHIVQNNKEGKELICHALSERGIKYVPSEANFVMLELGSAEKVASMHQALLRKGIAVRPLTAFGLPSCLRITVGTPEENLLLVQALKVIEY